MRIPSPMKEPGNDARLLCAYLWWEKKNGGKIPVWDICLIISLNYSLQGQTQFLGVILVICYKLSNYDFIN